MAKTPEKAPVSAAPEKKRYRLVRAYWDGRREFPVGAILAFVPGTQPRTAVLDTEPEPEMEIPEPKLDEGDDD